MEDQGGSEGAGEIILKVFFLYPTLKNGALGEVEVSDVSNPFQSHPKIARGTPNFFCDGIVVFVFIIAVVFIVVAFRYVVFSRLF